MMAIKKVLVPTDFGEASDSALAYGRELARRFGATLYVLHVAENLYLQALGAETYAAIAPKLQEQLERDAKAELDDLIGDGSLNDPPTKSAVITASSTAYAIVDYAKTNDIDLIVMGTHGRGPLAHVVMGSVAERVVRAAPCPVLTVRHPEHEFVWPDALTTRVAATA
jgi:nucleotide-binding universal stress UspA family protein